MGSFSCTTLSSFIILTSGIIMGTRAQIQSFLHYTITEQSILPAEKQTKTRKFNHPYALVTNEKPKFLHHETPFPLFQQETSIYKHNWMYKNKEKKKREPSIQDATHKFHMNRPGDNLQAISNINGYNYRP